MDPPVEGQDVKEVTKGVKEVDLEDKGTAEDAPSIRPEGVPLPDSPSGTPQPESESQEPELAEVNEVEESKSQKLAGDTDSIASSAPEYDVEEQAETESVTPSTDNSANEIAPAPEVTIAAVESGLHDIPEILEIKA